MPNLIQFHTFMAERERERKNDSPSENNCAVSNENVSN